MGDAVAGANSPGEPLAFFLSEPLSTREPKNRRRSVWLVACDEMAALTSSSAPDGVSLRSFKMTASRLLAVESKHPLFARTAPARVYRKTRTEGSAARTRPVEAGRVSRWQ